MSKSNSQYIHAHNAYRHTWTHIRTHTNTHIHTQTHTHTLTHNWHTCTHERTHTHCTQEEHAYNTHKMQPCTYIYKYTLVCSTHLHINSQNNMFLICKDQFKHFKILRLSVKRSDIITTVIAMIKRFKLIKIKIHLL